MKYSAKNLIGASFAGASMALIATSSLRADDAPMMAVVNPSNGSHAALPVSKPVNTQQECIFVAQSVTHDVQGLPTTTNCTNRDGTIALAVECADADNPQRTGNFMHAEGKPLTINCGAHRVPDRPAGGYNERPFLKGFKTE